MALSLFRRRKPDADETTAGEPKAPPRICVSDDALASAGGADRVVIRFAEFGHDVVRTSSWGMHWLEPLVEVDGIG